MTATLFMLLGGCVALLVEGVVRRRRQERAMRKAWANNGARKIRWHS